MYYCRAMMIAAISLLGLLLVAVFARYPGLLVVPALAVMWRFAQKKYALTAHGTARWAEPDELKRAGMFGGVGLPIGYVKVWRPGFWKSLEGLFDKSVPSAEACLNLMLSMRRIQTVKPASEMVWLNAVHTAVFAPTRAGKGVSLVVPYLLSCRDSCVVIDPKGENAKLTYKARKAMGQKIVILDPFKVVAGKPSTFNPLDAIDHESPTALDDCRALAREMVVRTGNEPDPHWNDSAEAFITAMMAATLFMPKEERNLQTVRTLLTNPALRQKTIAAMCQASDWGGMLARLGNQVANYEGKELAGILSTANRHLTFLDTLNVADSTKASTFTPAELVARKTTIYLVLPPEYLDSQSALLRLWVGSMLRACVRGGAQERNLVRFVLDEAASLGQMKPLEDAVDKFAGYGVRLIFIYQAIGQLQKCWREGMDQTLLSNCSTVYFGTRDYVTAEQVSKQLGEETIVVTSGGTSDGGSNQHSNGESQSRSTSASWNRNDNWQQHGRALLKPEEVLTLNPRVAITFTPGMRPICTYLSRYFERDLGNGRWRQLRTTAEVWLTAALMLLLSALGTWIAATQPLWRTR